MAKAIRSEFTRKDWEDLQVAKRILHDLVPKLDKAEACGIECEGFRQILDEMNRRFSLIEKHYLPEPPK